MTASRPNSNNDVCYGTLLSREQYSNDLDVCIATAGRNHSGR